MQAYPVLSHVELKMMELHTKHLLECVGVVWTIYYTAAMQEIMTRKTST